MSPKRSKTDKGIVCYISKDMHLKLRSIQIDRERETGVKPLLEELVSLAVNEWINNQ